MKTPHIQSAVEAIEQLKRSTAPAREQMQKLVEMTTRLREVAENASNDVVMPESPREAKFDGSLQSLIEVILSDKINSILKDKPPQFPFPTDMEAQTAIGKKFSDCTGEEALLLCRAYERIAARLVKQ